MGEETRMKKRAKWRERRETGWKKEEPQRKIAVGRGAESRDGWASGYKKGKEKRKGSLKTRMS